VTQVGDAMNNVVLMIVMPLLAAFLLPLVGRISESLARWLGPVVLLLSATSGVLLWNQVDGVSFALQLGGFPPLLGITLYVDRLALLLAMSVTLGALLLWPDEAKQDLKQSVLTLLLAGSGSGLALSGDLFNIYVFYELVAVVSYGLVAARGTPASLAATMRYVIISGVGAAMALAGIALVYQATDTLNLALIVQLAPQKLDNFQGLAAFALMLIGFGVKAELFPVNTWVPEVYACASGRVSALLAGIVSKLALVVIVRLLVLIFHQPQAMQLMLVLGLLGIVTGELAAWRAPDLKRMLAYSSVGQLGVMFVAFSIPGPVGVFAGLAVALHHMLVQPAFFLLAVKWGGRLEGLSGVARRAPLAAGLFVLLSLSLVGVPPLPGFWAKMLVVMSLLQQSEALYGLGAAVILAATVLEVSYMFKVVGFLYAQENRGLDLPAHSTRDLSLAGGLGALLLVAVFMMAPLSAHLQTIADQVADIPQYVRTVIPELVK